MNEPPAAARRLLLMRQAYAQSNPMRWMSALVIAGIGVGLVFPLLPWADRVAQLRLFGNWPLAPWLVAGCLMLAALILPVTARKEPRWPQARALALGMGLLLVLQPLLQLGLLWWIGGELSPRSLNLVWPTPPSQPSLQTWFMLLISLVLLPAVAEEWFFRGRLLGFLAPRLGLWSAISLSSLWFAAVHGQPLAMLVAVPMGLALGLLYHASGSLYACILVHAGHNLLMLTLGGLLLARPDLALLCFAAGLWLLLMAADRSWLQRYGPWRVVSLGILALLVLHGGYRWAQEQLWLRAASRQLASPAIPAQALLQRLDTARELRLLRPRRVDGLFARWPAANRRPAHEYWWLSAALEADMTVQRARLSTDGIYALLRHLAQHPEPGRRLQQAAAVAAAQHPPSLVDLLREDPQALPLLLPLDQYAELLIDVLASLDDRQRASFLAAVRLAYDRDQAAQLHLSIPAAAVRPRDRYYLLRHHPQGRLLIDRLAANDPIRHRAWQVPAP